MLNIEDWRFEEPNLERTSITIIKAVTMTCLQSISSNKTTTKVPHSTQVVISNQYIKYENYSCNTMAEGLSICSMSMHLDMLYISILKDNSFLKYDKQIFAFLCFLTTKQAIIYISKS